VFRWLVQVGVFHEEADLSAGPLSVTSVELVHHDRYRALALAQDVVRRSLQDGALSVRALEIVPLEEAEA
jgi:hypothetical protein